MGIQSIAHSAEAASPASSGSPLTSGDRCAIAGVPEQAHNVLAITLGPLYPVIVLGLLGQQLLPLHLGLHLGRDIRNDELHDASYDKDHVLEWDAYKI